jgi:hypothetical protein
MQTDGAARPASRDERRVDGVEQQAETGRLGHGRISLVRLGNTSTRKSG